MPGLTQEQIKQFVQSGCIVIPGELSSEQVKSLLDQSQKLLSDFSIVDHPMTKFQTGEAPESHVGDQYFLDSSDKVSFFFEEDAIDKDGNLTKRKDKAINKIGHALHVLDPAFKSVSLTQRNVDIAKSLNFKDPRILQSMLICKQPEIGGEVPTHQDGTFLYTEPQSAVGYWYALEDCTEENGPLEYVPGSHKTTPISKRMVRKGDGPGVAFEKVRGVETYAEPSKDKFRVCTCPAGSLVLIHNSVLHRSNKNLSENSRYAYAFHVIEGTAKYDERNWLQVPPTGGTNFTKLAV